MFLHVDGITCIEDLKEQILQNDTNFLSKLQYFSKYVPGFDAYWKEKKNQN